MPPPQPASRREFLLVLAAYLSLNLLFLLTRLYAH